MTELILSLIFQYLRRNRASLFGTISKLKSVPLVIYVHTHHYFHFILILLIFHICEKNKLHDIPKMDTAF